MNPTARCLFLACGLLACGFLFGAACSSPSEPPVDGMPRPGCSGCTIGQACDEGTCVDLPASCPCPGGSSCDPTSNRCIASCRSAKDCPPSTDPCQVAACRAGSCAMDARLDGSECAPLDACALSVCEAGHCVARSYNEGAPCPDDGNPCTRDVCSAARCTHPALPDGHFGTCPADADPCTNDVCIAGRCAHPPTADYTFCGSATGDGRFKQCLAGVCTWDKAFGTRTTTISCVSGEDATGMGTYTHTSYLFCSCSGNDLVFSNIPTMRVISCPHACIEYPPDIVTCL